MKGAKCCSGAYLASLIYDGAANTFTFNNDRWLTNGCEYALFVLTGKVTGKGAAFSGTVQGDSKAFGSCQPFEFKNLWETRDASAANLPAEFSVG